MNRIVPIPEPKQITAHHSDDFIDVLLQEYLDERVLEPLHNCHLPTGDRHQCSLLDHLEDHLVPADAPSVLMHIR